LRYPATNSNVIAVGAMSPCGKRPDEGLSCNNGTGTNFGNELDVVAPGILIRTTGLTGINGGITTFGATSSAAPHVSGVAALILSVNPCLTQLEVRQIIESTTQKVNANTPYVYSTNAAHPNGTWNIEMGHGLVNANAAVIEARNRLLLSVNKPNGVFSFAPQVITGNVTFAANAVVLSHDDIIIQSGGSLTINGTLIMARGKCIKVQQSGQLQVTGGRITALCGMWGGIQVWGSGQADYSSTNRGNANLTNATLEFALDALVAHNPASPSSSFGGMVGADNTIFRNNRHDIDIYGWNFTGWFTLCTFEVNNSYRHTDIRPRVTLNNANWQYSAFLGCKFVNNFTGNANSLGQPYSQWIGIESYGGGMFVDQAYDNGVYKKTTFERFYSGIKLYYISMDSWKYIGNCDFLGNVEAITSEGVNNFTISDNSFRIGGTNPFPSTLWYRTGITLNYSTGYEIQRNTFLASNNPPYPFGTLVSVSGSEPNKIDFNTYAGLYASNRVLGDNRDYSTGAGLQLRCNDSGLNIYDNVVEDGAGIASFQGSPSGSDGNLFSINGGAPDYYNGSYNPIYRYYVSGPRSLASTGGSTPIFQTSINTNGCVNGLQNNNVSYSRLMEPAGNGTYKQIDPLIASQSVSDVSILSSEERNDLASNFDIKNNALKLALSKYNALIDGGNAGKLILDIKNKWSKDATTLQKNLLTLSPNLSESVLMEVAQLGVLSQSVLMEILLANISSSKNKLFLEALKNNIPNPLSTVQIEKLTAAAVPPSVRLDLEIQINMLKGDVTGIGRQLVSDIYKSKGKYPVDSLRYWLSKLNSPEAFYSLAETHIKGAKSNDFEKSLKELSKDFKEIEKNKEDNDVYVNLYNLKSKILKSGRDFKEITDNEAEQIRAIAKGKKSKAALIANNILCYALGECSPMDVPRIKEDLQVRNFASPLANRVENEEPFFKAFPNPAKDIITIDYRLPKDVANVDFVITTITGIEVMRFKVNNNENSSFTFNTDKIGSGVYLITVQNQGKQLLSQKLSIIK
jgi:Subtilase family/Secretion system C-terminal sorting domain